MWIVAANKVGPLIPDHSIHAVAEKVGVPVERLHGVGEAQIVAPDGTVVAIGPKTGEAVVVADIDVDLALDKVRADGTDVFASRRPELYGPIAAEPVGRRAPAGAERIAAVAVTPAEGEDVTELLVRALAGEPELVVLPELAVGVDAIREAVAGTKSLVVTTVLEDGQHIGVVVGADGVVHRQSQLHACGRHSDRVVTLGDSVQVAELPWGRLAVVVGNDALYPETFRLVALQDADVVAVPFTPEKWVDLDPMLLERAAENRLNMVVAGPRTPALPGGMLVPLSPNFTLWGSGWERPFDGVISRPDPVVADGAVTGATLRPAQAVNRFVSKGTDLVDGRPWQLADSIVRPLN